MKSMPHISEDENVSLGAYFLMNPVIASTARPANIPVLASMDLQREGLSIAGLAGVRFDMFHKEANNPRVIISLADVSSKDIEFAGHLVRGIMTEEREPINLEGQPTPEERIRAEVTEIAVRTQTAINNSENGPRDIRVSFAKGVLTLSRDKLFFYSAGFGSVNFYKGYYDDERTRYAIETILPHAFLSAEPIISANASFLRPGVNPAIVAATIDLSHSPETWIFGGNDVFRKISQYSAFTNPQKDTKATRKESKGKFDHLRSDQRNYFIIEQMALWQNLDLGHRVEALVHAFMEQVDRYNFLPTQIKRGEDAAIAAIGVSLISNANSLSAS